MLDYTSAAHVATGLPTLSVVLLLRKGGRPPRGWARYRVRALGQDSLSLRYRVVALYALDARRMRERLPPEAAAFLVPMRGAGEPLVRSLAEDLVTRRDLPAAKRDRGLELLFIVTAAMPGAEAARRIFQMESILQTPGVQGQLAQWTADVGTAPSADAVLAVFRRA